MTSLPLREWGRETGPLSFLAQGTPIPHIAEQRLCRPVNPALTLPPNPIFTL